MAFTALVPPRQWSAVGPGFWVFYETNALGDGRPVRVTIHPDPFTFGVQDLVQGLRVQAYPPDEYDFADADGRPL